MNRTDNSAEYERLRLVLRQLRIEAGLTQVELAKRLKVPQSYISKYEGGDRCLDLIELRKVIDALRVPPGVALERFDPSWLRMT